MWTNAKIAVKYCNFETDNEIKLLKLYLDMATSYNRAEDKLCMELSEKFCPEFSELSHTYVWVLCIIKVMVCLLGQYFVVYVTAEPGENGVRAEKKKFKDEDECEDRKIPQRRMRHVQCPKGMSNQNQQMISLPGKQEITLAGLI